MPICIALRCFRWLCDGHSYAVVVAGKRPTPHFCARSKKKRQSHYISTNTIALNASRMEKGEKERQKIISQNVWQLCILSILTVSMRSINRDCYDVEGAWDSNAYNSPQDFSKCAKSLRETQQISQNNKQAEIISLENRSKNQHNDTRMTWEFWKRHANGEWRTDAWSMTSL